MIASFGQPNRTESRIPCEGMYHANKNGISQVSYEICNKIVISINRTTDTINDALHCTFHYHALSISYSE